MPRTKYATDSQEAAADRLIESVRPAVDALNEKHPGTWGLVKTALAGLVYNDCNWVANSVAKALEGKGDPSVYVDARVGLKAVDGKWFSRKTPAQITKAVAEIGKLMRGERKGNPKEAWPGASARSTEDVLRSYRDMREAVDSRAYRGTTLSAYKLSLQNYTKELKLRGVKVPTSAEVAAFYGKKPKKNPRIVAGWSTHNLGGGKQWFKRLGGGASVNVQQLRKGAAYEARKIDSAGKQHHLGSAKTLAAAKALALGRKNNPSTSPLARLDARTLAERASKAGWHDTNAEGRKRLAAYTAEMKRRLGRDPGDYPETLRAFYDELVTKKNPRYFFKGDRLDVKPPPLHARNAASHITQKQTVTALDEGAPGGWDVFDVRLDDGTEDSVYGFQIERSRKAPVGRAKKNPRQPKPKFALGDRVCDKDGGRPGEVSFIVGYTEGWKPHMSAPAGVGVFAHEGHQIEGSKGYWVYKVQQDNGPRHHRNEPNLRKLKKSEDRSASKKSNPHGTRGKSKFYLVQDLDGNVVWKGAASTEAKALALAVEATGTPRHLLCIKGQGAGRNYSYKNPKPLSKKALDKVIESLYYKHASGLQINIMDIGKVFAAGEKAYAAGGDVEQAVKDAIKVYCIKANPKKKAK